MNGVCVCVVEFLLPEGHGCTLIRILRVCAISAGHDLTATTLIAFNWTSCVDFHFALRVGGTGWRSDAVLYFRGHCHEGLLDVGRILS